MATYSLVTKDGVMVVDDHARTVQMSGQGGSLVGATTSVETAGSIEHRITATRLVLTGVFALAWKKKQDDRELYVLVDGADFSMIAQVDPAKGAQARRFAAGMNSIGKGQPGSEAMTERLDFNARNALSPQDKAARDASLDPLQRAAEGRADKRMWIFVGAMVAAIVIMIVISLIRGY